MEKYTLKITGKREYTLDFLAEFLDDQISLLNQLKRIVNAKRVYETKIDTLKSNPSHADNILKYGSLL